MDKSQQDWDQEHHSRKGGVRDMHCLHHFQNRLEGGNPTEEGESQHVGYTSQ